MINIKNFFKAHNADFWGFVCIFLLLLYAGAVSAPTADYNFRNDEIVNAGGLDHVKYSQSLPMVLTKQEMDEIKKEVVTNPDVSYNISFGFQTY